MLIDGVEWVRKSDANSNIKIVVCDRGFVLVGRINLDGNYITVSDCHCVRVWGTTRGLGEIASSGPTASTKLDKQPTTRVHELQVVQMIDCEEGSWKL